MYNCKLKHKTDVIHYNRLEEDLPKKLRLAIQLACWSSTVKEPLLGFESCIEAIAGDM